MYVVRKWVRRDWVQHLAHEKWAREQKAIRREHRAAALQFRLGKRIDSVPHIVTFFTHPTRTDSINMEVYEPTSCRLAKFEISAQRLLSALELEYRGPQQLRYVFSPRNLRCLATRVRPSGASRLLEAPLTHLRWSACVHWERCKAASQRGKANACRAGRGGVQGSAQAGGSATHSDGA